MDAQTKKEQLLGMLRAERARWEALLVQVGEARMNLSGVTGEWSVKDIVAHLTAWESRVVAWLSAVRAETWPAPPAWPTNLDEDQTNDWIYKANRGRRLSDILNDSRRVFDQLLEGLAELSDQDLTAINRFEWLGGNSLLEAIPGNSYAHYQVHGELIRNWLEQRQAQPQ